MRQLDGPRLEPRGKPSSLVVLLHGYGASGDDLIALARSWTGMGLPADAVFVSPHAPERLPHAGMGGYQWFALTFRDPGESWRGVTQTAPALDRFLDLELARYRLEPRRLALVGFSQGTMVALHIGLHRAQPPAAVVGYSGVVAGPERIGPHIKGRPPIQLIHGDRDDVIPVDAMHLTREVLAGHGLAVEWHVREGLGHGIDPDGLRLGGRFLTEKLK
ncbi:MAG: alpha/beta hydrolase [Hyphomicrobiaceae bacterium]